MEVVLREIEEAYAGIVGRPFTGYYSGHHVSEDTTGNSRMVICFRGDDEFEDLANGAIQGVNGIEQHHNIRIWKGVVGDWMCNLYIAPDSEITKEDAQLGNRFEVYRVQAVQINPERIRRWPFVCNLYVRALSRTTGKVE